MNPWSSTTSAPLFCLRIWHINCCPRLFGVALMPHAPSSGLYLHDPRPRVSSRQRRHGTWIAISPVRKIKHTHHYTFRICFAQEKLARKKERLDGSAQTLRTYAVTHNCLMKTCTPHNCPSTSNPWPGAGKKAASPEPSEVMCKATISHRTPIIYSFTRVTVPGHPLVVDVECSGRRTTIELAVL